MRRGFTIQPLTRDQRLAYLYGRAFLHFHSAFRGNLENTFDIRSSYRNNVKIRITIAAGAENTLKRIYAHLLR